MFLWVALCCDILLFHQVCRQIMSKLETAHQSLLLLRYRTYLHLKCPRSVYLRPYIGSQNRKLRTPKDKRPRSLENNRILGTCHYFLTSGIIRISQIWLSELLHMIIDTRRKTSLGAELLGPTVVLNYATMETNDPDVSYRACICWRLLSIMKDTKEFLDPILNSGMEENSVDPPQSVQRGVTELVEAALLPRNLCMMDPTWHPWF
ncbi:Armadillo-type fold [Artemisia annua]|uniref:Armadillo-type fold n=1 Tax=Artemisia annua TaxID=35608 RepID=A0A2U1KH91_ARTAN|nr:Armadillo-type fold [Artemisia annua]